MKVAAPNHEPGDTSDAREVHRLLTHLKVVELIQAAAFPALGVAAGVSLFWAFWVLPVTAVASACAVALARWVVAHHKKKLLTFLAKDAELKPDERRQVEVTLNRVSIGGPAES